MRLRFELLKMQERVRLQGLRVCVLFEGRDAAGKGGVIKRAITGVQRHPEYGPCGHTLGQCLKLQTRR